MTIPLRDEAIRSIQGALLLARFDVRGMQLFSLTLDGFWRSFFAAVLVAPFAVIVTTLTYPSGVPERSAAYTLEAIQFATEWIAFPLVMIPVARLLGLSASYVPYIIAYNWTQVVQSLLFFPIAVLSARGLVGSELAQILNAAALLYLLAYLVFVARSGLKIPTLTAVGIVVLNVVFTFLVFYQAQRLLYG